MSNPIKKILSLTNGLNKKQNGKGNTEFKVNTKIKVLKAEGIILGFQRGASKKHLLIHLEAKAKSMGFSKNIMYSILKKDGGFYWEIHNGGSGHGCMGSILSILEKNEDARIIIETSGRFIQCSKPKGRVGIECIILSEGDSEGRVESEGVYFQDKMKPLSSTGVGFYLFGAIFMACGILSAVSSVTIHQIYANKDKIDTSPENKTPFTMIYEIESRALTMAENEYIKNVTFNKDKNLFEINMATEEMPGSNEITNDDISKVEENKQ